MNAIEKVGVYASLMYRTITKPDRWSIFWKQYVNEVKKQGIDSLWIVVIISTFIGEVITIQMVLNTENHLFPT